MKIQKRELAVKLNKIKDVVPKRTTMPILQGVLVKDGYLIANNMAMTVKVKLEGTENECFIIPDRAFELINNLPEGEVDISVSENYEMLIRADKIKNTYQTMSPEIFPLNSIKDGRQNIEIKSEILIDCIKRVSYAIPQQGTNNVITSMCLHAENGTLDFVGLDGRMLAWDKVKYNGDFELLIPKDTVDKLKTIGFDGNVKILYNNSEAVFSTADFEIYTRLAEGKYFKYKAMFKDMALHTVVSRIELLNALTRSQMCTDEKIPVYFEFKDNNLKISVKVYYKVIFKHLISAAIMVGGFIGIARVIRPSSWIGLIVSAIIMCISGLIIHVLIMCNMDEKLFLIKKITKRK